MSSRAGVAAALGAPGDVAERIFGQTDASTGPSLSRFLQREATAEQFREALVHRSIYQLKEADPHSTAIARLPAGAAKTALLDIQVDEYGPEPSEAHAVLFAETMDALDLDAAVALARLNPAVRTATGGVEVRPVHSGGVTVDSA